MHQKHGGCRLRFQATATVSLQDEFQVFAPRRLNFRSSLGKIGRPNAQGNPQFQKAISQFQHVDAEQFRGFAEADLLIKITIHPQAYFASSSSVIA